MLTRVITFSKHTHLLAGSIYNREYGGVPQVREFVGHLRVFQQLVEVTKLVSHHVSKCVDWRDRKNKKPGINTQ